MRTAEQAIVDAFDLETFLLCDSPEEAKSLILQFFEQRGFEDTDLLSIDFRGFGARVRARVYLNRPGAVYSWLGSLNAEGAVS